MTETNINIESITKEIRRLYERISKRKLEVACYLHYVYDNDLIKPYYNDIYDYSEKNFGVSKRQVSFYLSVVIRFYIIPDWKNEFKEFPEVCLIPQVYTPKEPYMNFSFSQLKACLSLSDEEIKKLNITEEDPVRLIERKIKDYKSNFNKLTVDDVRGSDHEEPEVQEEEFEHTFQYSDKEVNKNCLENNFIPADSDYEIIFRNDNKTLIKDKKSQKCVVTALKMLRTYIENNCEDSFYYAVVKIPKGLS